MNFMNIIKLNGIYDIICGLSIIFNINKYISHIHLSICKKKKLEYLGLIILIWGIIRLLSNNKLILSLTYIYEIILFIYLYYKYECNNYKILFIIILSLLFIIGIFIPI